MVHDTDIVELELRSKRFSLAVRKKEAIEALEPQVVYQVCLCSRPRWLQSGGSAPAPATLLTAQGLKVLKSMRTYCSIFLIVH